MGSYHGSKDILICPHIYLDPDTAFGIFYALDDILFDLLIWEGPESIIRSDSIYSLT